MAFPTAKEDKPHPLKISLLPFKDRPREKLITSGKETLTTIELLAIIIGAGTKKNSALDLAKKVFESCSYSTSNLHTIHHQKIAQIQGIGLVKAIKISAALELGNRIINEDSSEKKIISNPQDIFNTYRLAFNKKKVEIFQVLLLNNSNRVLGHETISIGGISQTTADPRIILRHALDYQASSIVLMHNHPSGNLKPSEADIQITHKIKKAAELIDVRVIDHLIFTSNNYFSFATNNLL